MADPDKSSARRSGGKHGAAGSGGLSAAELIARSRAASPDAPERPSRSARRAAEHALAGRPVVAPAAEQALESGPALQPVVTGSVAEPVVAVGPVGQPVALGPVTEQAASVDPVELPAAVTRHLTVVEAPAISEIVPPAKSRAGRNLPAAIGVGVGLGALVIATLLIYRPSFVVLIGLAIAVGVYEVVTAIGTVEARPPLVPLLAGVAAVDAAAWFRGPEGMVGALLLTVLGLTIWRLADGAAGYLRDVAAGNLVALYVPFLSGFAVLMTHADDGVARIIMFILAVVCSDTGGYVAGVLFGKHPMAPTVSPKKSWEGFAGSVLAGGDEGILLMTLCFHHAWWQGAIFGVALVVTATLGDLGESMIKRDLGLKDMGNLLPGHGGLMDRLDSLLPCAPVAYLLMAAFLR